LFLRSLFDGRTGAIRKASIWRDRLPFVNHFYSKQTAKRISGHGPDDALS